MKKLVYFFLLLLTGCSCTPFYADRVEIVHGNEKFMSCKHLKFMMEEGHYLLRNLQRRYQTPHVYTPYPGCYPFVQIDSINNQFALQDRINMLHSFYTLRGCEQDPNLEKMVKKSKADIPHTVTPEEVELPANKE